MPTQTLSKSVLSAKDKVTQLKNKLKLAQEALQKVIIKDKIRKAEEKRREKSKKSAEPKKKTAAIKRVKKASAKKKIES